MKNKTKKIIVKFILAMFVIASVLSTTYISLIYYGKYKIRMGKAAALVTKDGTFRCIVNLSDDHNLFFCRYKPWCYFIYVAFDNGETWQVVWSPLHESYVMFEDGLPINFDN